MTEAEIIKSLTRLADGDIMDTAHRKVLIRLLVNKIYLYDDKCIITINIGDDEHEVSRDLLDEIEKEPDEKEFCVSNDSGHQHSPVIVGKICGDDWR